MSFFSNIWKFIVSLFKKEDKPEPKWITFENPMVPDDPTDSKWKVYGQPYHQGRRNSVRWSSVFVNDLGCDGNNTTCILKDADNKIVLLYDFYAIDQENGKNRLSFTQKSLSVEDMPNKVWALLYKNDNLVGAFGVENPTADRWFVLPKTAKVLESWLTLN